LFAAARYARSVVESGGTPDIVVLERRARPCRKLLLSGSGQCNLTHAGPVEDFLERYGGGAKPGAAARFLRPSLLEWTNEDLLGWFRARGLEFEAEDGGKVFPVTHRAGSILEILTAEASLLGVAMLGGRRVTGLGRNGSGFVITGAREPADGTSANDAEDGPIMADAVLIATGGASYPVTGSSGDGYALAAGLGHPVIDPRPALAPVIVDRFPLASVAGLSFRDAGLVIRRGGKKAAARTGDVLITHRGLSGPLVLDSSRGIMPGDRLEVRFADVGYEAFRSRFDERLAASPRRLVKTALAECGLPRSLAEAFCAMAGISGTVTAAELRRASRDALCGLACAFPFDVAALGGMDEAMATAGGVDLGSVNPKSMESRIVPGLFFAGEVLDVDGDSGGYNLQAAFSTGAMAAKGMAARRVKSD
jgi:predicted Rossmann fold flavoprotein